MLLMCNETVIRRMFKRDPAKFTDKIWDFAVKAGGAVGRKIKRFMKSEEYAKILINKATRNWPEPDANESREIKRYIRMAKFSQILKSDQHRRNIDKLTFQTTSRRLCYWCLNTGCFNNRRIANIPNHKEGENYTSRVY